MSGKSSKRVSFSPNINDKPRISLKHNSSTRVAGNRKRFAGICSFRLSKSSKFFPVKFLRRLGAQVAKALSLVFMKKRKRSSVKVSSSNSERWKRQFVSAALDSQRKEAIEDCIEFINSSSSSLQRSNSVSADSC